MIYYFNDIRIVGSLVLLLVILICFLKIVKKKSYTYLLCFVIMYIYLCYIIDLTQFPIYATEGMRTAMGGQNVWREMTLIPFKTIINQWSIDMFFNLIMTVPLGFGLPFLVRCTWPKVALIGLMTGVMIESVQLIFALCVGFTFRHVSIDDVILNFMGTLLGYVIFKVFSRLFKWSYHKFNVDTNSILTYIADVCSGNSEKLK